MEYKINNLENWERELEFTLSQADLKPHFDEAYKKAQADISIKGFRKGKVPVQMIKQMYGPSIEAEATEDIINAEWKKLVDSKVVTPFSAPILVDIKRDNNNFTAILKYEIPPEFDLGEYKGLSLKEFVHVVSDDEIAEQIDNVLFDQGERENITDGSIENDNYIAFCEPRMILADGSIDDNAKSNPIPIVLKTLPAEDKMKVNLINAKIGDTFEWSSDEVKEANKFRFEVKEILKIVPAELNDEFVKKITQNRFDNVKDYREEVGYNLQEDWDAHTREFFEKQINDKLIEMHKFELPARYFEEFIQANIDRLKKQYPKDQNFQNATPETIDDEFRAFLSEAAKLLLIKGKIIASEKLEVEAHDYEDYVDFRFKGIEDKEPILNYVKNAPEFENEILNKKFYDFILDFAITDQQDFDDDFVKNHHHHHHNH